jgi:hypothetical protein
MFRGAGLVSLTALPFFTHKTCSCKANHTTDITHLMVRKYFFLHLNIHDSEKLKKSCVFYGDIFYRDEFINSGLTYVLCSEDRQNRISALYVDLMYVL